jgi:hypothetical protein
MIVIYAGWDAVDAATSSRAFGARTSDVKPGEAFGGDGWLRTAKSCGPDAPMLASSP